LLRSLSLDEKQCCNLEVDEAPAGDRKQGLEEEKAAVKGFLEEEAPAESCAEEKAVPPEEEEEEVDEGVFFPDQIGVWNQNTGEQAWCLLAVGNWEEKRGGNFKSSPCSRTHTKHTTYIHSYAHPAAHHERGVPGWGPAAPAEHVRSVQAVARAGLGTAQRFGRGLRLLRQPLLRPACNSEV